MAKNKCPMILALYPPGYEPGHPYYTLHHTESDTSQLYLGPKGTSLDPSLPREFEFQVKEKDNSGYSALAGQLSNWKEAIEYLLGMANLTLEDAPEFKGAFRTSDPSDDDHTAD